LIIVQTDEVHREVADLLAQLRRPQPAGREKPKQ
jgi:hypothetical protein